MTIYMIVKPIRLVNPPKYRVQSLLIFYLNSLNIVIFKTDAFYNQFIKHNNIILTSTEALRKSFHANGTLTTDSIIYFELGLSGRQGHSRTLTTHSRMLPTFRYGAMSYIHVLRFLVDTYIKFIIMFQFLLLKFPKHGIL